jgi:excisionase family DNA binding protein
VTHDRLLILDEGDRLLTPGEVAKLCDVDRKTPRRWVHAGLLSTQRTLGGHYRYSENEVREFMQFRSTR